MQENKAETASPKASLSPKTKRRRILFLAGPCIVLAATVFFYWTGGRYVETDNAYIQADKVIISAEVSGTIESIHIKENAQVKKGDPLSPLIIEVTCFAWTRLKHTSRQKLPISINSKPNTDKSKTN